MRFPTPHLQSVLRASALLAAFVVAGVLFLGIPAASSDPSLPDPEEMAAIGDGRNSSAEILDFWAERADQAPSAITLTRLAEAQLTLAGDTGDLAGYEVAEETALAAVQLDPDDDAAVLVLAASRSGQHDFVGALELANRLLENNPQSVGALLTAGDAEVELGHVMAARGLFDRATAEAGGAAPLLSRYARLESLTGSLDESHELARRALVRAGTADLRHADAAFYWFQLATFEFASGDLDEAADHVETALSIDPANLASLELHAKTLAALGRHDEAIASYEALVDGGGAADLHGELAKLYDLAGRHDEARVQVDLGLAVAARYADRFPAEWRHLIGFLADHDPDEALRLAELDLAERQDVHAYGWYAWSLFQTGQFDQAAAAIDPALALGTQDAMLLYQAGTIKAAAGDTDAGRRLLQQALDLNPEFDLVHAAAARSLLAELSGGG